MGLGLWTRGFQTLFEEDQHPGEDNEGCQGGMRGAEWVGERLPTRVCVYIYLYTQIQHRVSLTIKKLEIMKLDDLSWLFIGLLPSISPPAFLLSSFLLLQNSNNRMKKSKALLRNVSLYYVFLLTLSSQISSLQRTVLLIVVPTHYPAYMVWFTTKHVEFDWIERALRPWSPLQRYPRGGWPNRLQGN